MKNVLCFLLSVGVTFLQATSSEPKKDDGKQTVNKQDMKTGEQQLKSSINLPLNFDEQEISPLDGLNCDITAEEELADNEALVINLPIGRIVTSDNGSVKKTNIFNKKWVLKEVTDMIACTTKRIVKTKSGQLEQSITYCDGQAKDKFLKTEDGRLEKTTTVVKYSGAKYLKRVTLKDGIMERTVDDQGLDILEKLTIGRDNEIIETLQSAYGYRIETTISYKDGRWIHASGETASGENLVIGPNNYMTSEYQSRIDDSSVNRPTESIIRETTLQNGRCGYNVYSEKQGKEISKTFLNKGIIFSFKCLMINGYQRCSNTHTIDLSSFPEGTFEDISKFPAKTRDFNNVGYLVHFSPNGQKWRTQNKDIIQQVLNGDKTLTDDCGYTEYISSDGNVLWIENEGIVENGELVVNSRRLFDLGFAYKYVSGGHTVMWSKSTTSNSRPNSGDITENNSSPVPENVLGKNENNL